MRETPLVQPENGELAQLEALMPHSLSKPLRQKMAKVAKMLGAKHPFEVITRDRFIHKLRRLVSTGKFRKLWNDENKTDPKNQVRF